MVADPFGGRAGVAGSADHFQFGICAGTLHVSLHVGAGD